MTSISKRAASISPSMTLAVSAKANELKAAGERVINFGVGEPDFDTPANIVAAAKDALDSGYTRYVAAAGLPALKKSVCGKLLKDNGLEYDQSQIVITNGAKHAIFNSLFVTIDEGDEVIIPSPYWLTYPEAVKSCGGVPVFVPTEKSNGYKMTARQLEGAITPKTKMLILNTPCNPTGAVYGADELKEIADVCLKNDIWVLSDEIYEKLVYDGVHISIASLSPRMKERTIVINGLSKSYAMTGWRLGYLAAPPEIARAAAAFQSHTTSNVNTMTQYAALAALEGDQNTVEKMRLSFRSRRDCMIKLLESYRQTGLDFVKPEGAFYVMLGIENLCGKKFGGREIKGSMDVADLLLTEEKVAVTPGICFGDDGAVRLSYALAPADMEEGLKRIAKFAREVVGG